MMVYQNIHAGAALGNLTQPISMVHDQKQYLNVKDKLMKRYVQNSDSQQQ